MTTVVIHQEQVSSVDELLSVVTRYGDRNSVYVDIVDHGLCYIDCQEDVVEIYDAFGGMTTPIADLGKDAFPTLVVVTGLAT